MKICPQCSTIHAPQQEACPPLVKCPSCGKMYREGKGCLFCVIQHNPRPSASFIFKPVQEEDTTQNTIHWLYDDGSIQIGVARQDVPIITDEAHLYTVPVREQDEPIVTPLPEWLFS